MNKTYNIRYFSSFSDLPDAVGELVQGEIDRSGLFRKPEWFEHLMKHFYAEDNEPRLYVVEELASGVPLLFMPLRYTRSDYAANKAKLIGSISHPENYSTAALFFAPSVSQPAEVLEALFSHLRLGGPGEPREPVDVLRIWPVEPDSELADVIYRALERSGFRVQIYANSYNRFEDTAGLSYESYFFRRSANMRYNVRRRQRALEKTGGLELVMVTDPADLERAFAEYMQVSKSSWKTPVTMSSLETLQFMGLCAGNGCLRLGILRLGGHPAAAQFWIVNRGEAHCSRLAYDEAYKKQAVGVVLTNFMIAQVLDRDRVGRIDFGLGPDEYKRGWMNDSRHYFGFMAFNPSTPLGRLYGFRHIYGSRAKRLGLSAFDSAKRPIKRILGGLGWKRFQTSQTNEE
jgi:CelD/BcsL family acetyltransferase involved in cellulose biosynthesis